MKAIGLAATIGLTMFPLAARAAQEAPPAATPTLPAAATPPAAPAPDPAVAARQLEAARAALTQTDVERLLTNRDYAAEILAHLDVLAAGTGEDAELGLNIDALRLFALMTLERPDDIRPIVDRLIGERSTAPAFYAAPFFAAASIQDGERVAAVIDTASRNVAGVNWATLRGIFEKDYILPVLQQMRLNHQEEARVRMAGALFRIGWPGDGDEDNGDFIRSILIEDRVAHNDPAAASDFAAGIATPGGIVSLIVRTRYDGVLTPGEDRLALLRRTLDLHDASTAAAVAAAPANPIMVLARVQHLRSIGRNADALTLLQPFTRDVRRTVTAHPEGMWLVNEAGYALLALGRNDDSLRLMEQLVAIPVAGNPRLVSAAINLADMLISAGRYAEALAWTQALERDASRFASDYGKAWIVAATVCSLTRLNRSAEAAPHVERLRALAEANPSALTEAHLCVGDDDAAAALVVSRLESDDPESAILALQDYALSQGPGQADPIYARLTALRERPAVRAALDRVGRVMTLPLSRSYWGNF